MLSSWLHRLWSGFSAPVTAIMVSRLFLAAWLALVACGFIVHAEDLRLHPRDYWIAICGWPVIGAALASLGLLLVPGWWATRTFVWCQNLLFMWLMSDVTLFVKKLLIWPHGPPSSADLAAMLFIGVPILFVMLGLPRLAIAGILSKRQVSSQQRSRLRSGFLAGTAIAIIFTAVAIDDRPSAWWDFDLPSALVASERGERMDDSFNDTVYVRGRLRVPADQLVSFLGLVPNRTWAFPDWYFDGTARNATVASALYYCLPAPVGFAPGMLVRINGTEVCLVKSLPHAKEGW